MAYFARVRGITLDFGKAVHFWQLNWQLLLLKT